MWTRYTNASNTCTTELLLRPGHTYDVLLNWQKKDEYVLRCDGTDPLTRARAGFTR